MVLAAPPLLLVVVDEPDLGVLDELDELPHAATVSASATATPSAPTLRILATISSSCLSDPGLYLPTPTIGMQAVQMIS
jgi:hypothetical protein